MREVGFRIKLPLARETTDSQKQLDKLGKGLDSLEKKTVPALAKKTKEYLGETRKGLQETTGAVERFGRAFSESIERNLTRISRFNERIHKTREKIFGLKEAFEATAIGAATFFAGEKLIEGGRAEMRARMRVRREFGGEAGFISESAEKAARSAGLEGADATRMLIPLAETLRDTVQEGARFRGLKGPLTATQAAELRRKNLEVGSTLMQRMSVLAPEMDAATIGQVMNDALTGPEGVRSLISAFNLSKRSRTLSEMNEKGQAFKALSPEERSRLGITKAGQFIQQADLVQLMVERSGFTAGAAKDEMKTLDFQLKAIGNSFKNVFGEVGESMMSKLDGGLSKGATLSERLNTYLDKNKDTIRHIGDELGDAAHAVGEFASKLPKVGAFLTEHKTALLALGGAFVGFKALAGIGGIIEKGKKVPGIGEALGGGKGIPVYVTNWGGKAGSSGIDELKGKGKGLLGIAAAGGGGAGLLLAAAGVIAGYGGGKAGLYLNNHSKTANKLYTKEAGFIDSLFGGNYQKLEDSEVERNRLLLAKQANKRKSLVESLEAAGLSHGQAVALATGVTKGADVDKNGQTIHVTLVADGKVLAQVVTPHITRDTRNKTADGAAATWR